MAITKESFMKQNAPKVHKVDVPEVGDVHLVQICGDGDDAYRRQMMKDYEPNKYPDMARVNAIFAAYSICDEEGNLLFGPNGIDEVNKIHYKKLANIAEAVKEISGYNKATIEEEKNA